MVCNEHSRNYGVQITTEHKIEMNTDDTTFTHLNAVVTRVSFEFYSFNTTFRKHKV